MTSPAAALPEWTAALAQAALATLGTPFERQGETLRHASGFVAVVDMDCTAAVPVLLGLAALLVFGALARLPRRRRATFALVVAAGLAVANQLRLVAVLWAGANAPAHFGWLHEVAGPLMLVAVGAAVVAAAVRGRLAPAWAARPLRRA